MSNLMRAHNQWATRSPDSRFSSLEEMLGEAQRKFERSSEHVMRTGSIKVVPDGDKGILIEGSHGAATPSNWAFEQLCRRVGFYPSAAASLNADLVARCLNYRIAETDRADDGEGSTQFLVDKDEDGATIRATTSDSYARFHDKDFIPTLIGLEDKGWRVPPCRPAFDGQPGTRPARADEVGIWGKGGVQIREGDPIAPGNMYMGDRDMFVLMANPDRSTDDGGGNSLMRGIMASNSEVGARSLSITSFTMQGVCGNAIIWGAQDILTVSYRHIGKARARIKEALANLNIGENDNWDRELKVMDWMRKNKLGDTKDTVIENLYGMRVDNLLTKSVIGSAYDNAAQHDHQDGSPNTYLGFANALTRWSQTLNNADMRYNIDAAAGKLFDKASKLVGV